MLGRNPEHLRPVKPIRDGVIADFDAAEKMLTHFIRKTNQQVGGWVRPRVVIGVPAQITPVERRAVKDSAYRAKASEVHLVDEPMAAALGAGLPVTEAAGNMIIDIGGGTTDIAVISLAGVVISRSVRVAGDAFDRASLTALDPQPTIAIVSGLFELLPETEPLRRSLAGLADAVESGGYLIYTCQPWHPQVEFIARVLSNREGQAWVMRRRTQAEMDALVRAAGFEKVDQLADRWGIFTVALARRV